jgi:hypothetical protein
MATSLLIAYPDIPVSAMTWKAEVAGVTTPMEEEYPVESLFYGERSNYAIVDGNVSSLDIQFDLGAGFTKAVDHLILGGVDGLITNLVTKAVVQGSTDASSWVDQMGTNADFLTRTLSGPDSNDVVFTQAFNDTIAASPLTAYRYWRLRLASSIGSTMPFSKLYFGTFFDMGEDPESYDWEVISDDVDTWRYPRGHVIMSKSTHARHRFTITWNGITDAKAASFATTILKNPYRNSVFLYAATYLDPLAGQRCVHCKVLSEECTVSQEYQDWNKVVAVFEELV